MTPWLWALSDDEMAAVTLLAEDERAGSRKEIGEIRAGLVLRLMMGFVPTCPFVLGVTSGLELHPVWTAFTAGSVMGLSIMPKGEGLLVLTGEWMGDDRIVALHGFTTMDKFRRESKGTKVGRKTMPPFSIALGLLAGIDVLWDREAPESHPSVCVEPFCRALFTSVEGQHYCPRCNVELPPSVTKHAEPYVPGVSPIQGLHSLRGKSSRDRRSVRE